MINVDFCRNLGVVRSEFFNKCVIVNSEYKFYVEFIGFCVLNVEFCGIHVLVYAKFVGTV